jgi:hypothetical protein
LSAARGVSFGAVTEALSFGHGVALVLELGKLPAPLLAGCDVVRVLVEIVHCEHTTSIGRTRGPRTQSAKKKYPAKKQRTTRIPLRIVLAVTPYMR